MKKLITAFSAFLLALSSNALAENQKSSGNFYMCPDAHGEQKALFKIIDITKMPMRIEGLGQRRVDGFAAYVEASRYGASVKDPFGEASKKLAAASSGRTKFNQQVVEVCFASDPPTTNDTDGPFYYMPGYFAESPSTAVPQPFDSVFVPEQTYLVLSFKGQSEDIGNMRFTLTEEFWPKVAPFLGLERAIGPNLMIFAQAIQA